MCAAVSRPVNVLAWPGLTVAEIAGAGAQRISLGGSLAWVAVAAMAKAAEQIRDEGDFASLWVKVPMNEWLASYAAALPA